MAYPFLPVNPSCTDVVINDVCGCSSVITNSGCNTNNPCSTILTASSTIVYNGPALTCTTAEPCDTLNVILQKIDEIICNLLSQISTLTTQVNNINSQVVIINNDIINIYNTLDVCCTTTTTTTIAIPPCRSFLLTNTEPTPLAIIINDCITGSEQAIILLPGDTNVCVESNSLLVLPGTVIATPTGPCNTTTTTTSSSSTTTTTTTIFIPCECLTINNTDSVGQYFSYTDCDDITSDFIPIAAGEIIKVCGCCAVSTNPLVTISIGADCVGAVCPTTTTTTTICTRPSGLITKNYFNSYTYASVLVDYTATLLDACNACNFIKDNITGITQETSLFGQSASFAIGQHVYAGLVTYCIDLADGFYITDHETCEITQVVGGYIVSITNCATTTTTTTAYPYTCSCVHVIISQTDLDDATGNTPGPGKADNTVYLTTTKNSGCDDSNVDTEYTVAGLSGFCIKTSALSTIQLFYYKNNNPVYFPAIASTYNILYANCSVNGQCIPA